MRIKSPANEKVGIKIHPDLPKRMYLEAMDRIDDADFLASSLKKSDSDTLIRILGFEILLKCAVLLCTERLVTSHNYAKLWSQVSNSEKQLILEEARDRMPGHADLSDIDKLLKAYQYIFEQARYSYEVNMHLSDDDVHRLGQNWEERGAPVDDAQFSYYPCELRCLIAGVSKFISGRLGIERQS